MDILKSPNYSTLLILAILSSQAVPVLLEIQNIQQNYVSTHTTVIWMMIFEHISGKSVCSSNQL